MVLLACASASAWGYDYPINDPFLATVVGTPEVLQADLPDKFPMTIRRLPKVSGLEFLQIVRRKGLSIPLIMTTAYATVKDAVSSLNVNDSVERNA